MTHVIEKLGMSQRAACKLVGQHRSTQRRIVKVPTDEPELLAGMYRLSAEHPRYGYRRIHRMLLEEGWRINHKRVQRLWRREGLRIPRKQRKRRRKGDSGNSCIRRRAEYKGHMWTYDFLFDRTEDGRRVKILAVVDEYTRECVGLYADRSIKAKAVVDVLAAAMVEHGVPKHIRSDNGTEFVAADVRRWLARVGTGTLFVAPGSPWENGYIESSNSRLRDELLNRELFVGLAEVRFLLDQWRTEYNERRIHSSLGYKTPASFAAGCAPSGIASLSLQAHTPRAAQAPEPHQPQLTRLT